MGEKSVEKMHVLGDRMLSVGQKVARKFRWSKKLKQERALRHQNEAFENRENSLRLSRRGAAL